MGLLHRDTCVERSVLFSVSFFFRRSIPRLFASFSSSMLAFLFFLHFVTFDRLFSFVTVYLCEILVFREGAV